MIQHKYGSLESPRFDFVQEALRAQPYSATIEEITQEFVEALEYGMPPTAGHGFSERFFAFLMNKPAREIQLFPLMRPRKE